MTDDAIQQDVSEEVQNEVTEVENTEVENKPVDVRHDAIEALAEQRAEEIAAEVEPEVVEAVEEEPTEPEQEETERLIKVKVDGEEVELPLTEVVKGYQKDATASKRLDEVAEERRLLEKKEVELAEAMAKLESKPEQEEQPSSDVDSSTAERLADAIDELSVADNEADRIKAATALKELLGGRGDNPAIQEDELVSQAARQATEEALLRIQYTNAQTKFAEDYQDIVEDPILYQMAVNAFQEAVPKSQTYDEAFKAAGEATRQWKEQLVSKDREAHSMQDKKALKEQLEQDPVSIGSRAEKPPAKKPESPSDIIAAIAASRGQSV